MSKRSQRTPEEVLLLGLHQEDLDNIASARSILEVEAGESGSSHIADMPDADIVRAAIPVLVGFLLQQATVRFLLQPFGHSNSKAFVKKVNQPTEGTTNENPEKN